MSQDLPFCVNASTYFISSPLWCEGCCFSNLGALSCWAQWRQTQTQHWIIQLKSIFLSSRNPEQSHTFTSPSCHFSLYNTGNSAMSLRCPCHRVSCCSLSPCCKMDIKVLIFSISQNVLNVSQQFIIYILYTYSKQQNTDLKRCDWS